MKHYYECPSTYHCVCNIISDRNKFRAALRKILKIRRESTCYPFPDSAASLVAVANDALKAGSVKEQP